MAEVQWMDQEPLSQGPTKDVLKEGFFARRPIRFADRVHQFDVTINELMHEDGSKESFIFKGFVVGEHGRQIRGYWRTDTRRGFCFFENRVRVVTA